MAFDPKKPEWVSIAEVDPREIIGIDRVEFSLRPVWDRFTRVLGDESVFDSGILRVSLREEWWDDPLAPNKDLVIKGFAQRQKFWAKHGLRFLQRWMPHDALHRWLIARLSERKFADGAGLESYMLRFLEIEPDWLSKFNDVAQPEVLMTALDDHNSAHQAFQLWCIFREAAVRITLGKKFPEWLREDLNGLARQAIVVYKLTPEGPRPEELVGPPAWALDVLKRLRGDRAEPEILMDLCTRCGQQYDKHRRGHPSSRCRDCLVIGRREDERERKRRARRTAALAYKSGQIEDS